jgi:hypothetical protein
MGTVIGNGKVDAWLMRGLGGDISHGSPTHITHTLSHTLTWRDGPRPLAGRPRGPNVSPDNGPQKTRPEAGEDSHPSRESPSPMIDNDSKSAWPGHEAMASLWGSRRGE